MPTKLDHLRQFEEETIDNIDALKPEFIHDWEDEFDDIHEAYDEQGRGEAESQALQELVRREYPDIDDGELVYLMDTLADLWNISMH